MGNDDRRDLEKKANLAIDTFRAMFGDMMPEHDEEFLLASTEDTIIQRFMGWVREKAPRIRSGGQDDAGADIKRRATAKECSELLKDLTSETNASGTATTWPFIRKIKVYLRAHILSKGLILVDLPGLRDLNSARLKTTERYILSCDEVFAVINIGRAKTDQGVRGIFELAKAARLSKVGIVCTRSDEYPPEEALNDWQGARATTIRRLMDAIETRKREHDETEAALDDFGDVTDLGDEDKEEQRELMATSRRLK